MNEYYKELEDIATRTEADGTLTSLVIACALRTLMGVIHSPPSMQRSFCQHIADYARVAKMESQMLQSGRWSDD
jgi:hypothetical protein